MNPEDKIKELISKSDITVDAQTENRILGDALKHLDILKQRKSPLIGLYIWRMIMKSPITKIAAAAVIIIACLTGLHFWRSTGSGIALADVLTRIDQITGYMYQMNTKTTKQGNSTTSTSTILVSKNHGSKTITKVVDPNTGKITRHDKYALLGQKSWTQIVIYHDKKIYFSMKYEGTPSENPKEEVDDPRTMIKNFLSCEHTSLGQSIIDGITVEGFQTTDLAYNWSFSDQAHQYMARLEKVNARIWVDVNTFLPVRTEEEIVRKVDIKGGYGTQSENRHDSCYDFRWNVVVDASDFEPNIPDDYTNPGGTITFAPFTEESAIEGLKLFAALTKHYPADPPNGTKFRDQTRELIGYKEGSWEALPEDEKNRRNNEILKPILGFAVFYKMLFDEENKDLVYYGETVKPGDADEVLLRWKLDDGQYRVIFGDLSVKNVTAQELAELEKP